MFHKKIQLIPVMLLPYITGCALTSEVVPFGSDTYIVSVDDPWGERSPGYLTVKAAQAANAHCKKIGRKMDVVTKKEVSGEKPSSTLTFSCNSNKVKIDDAITGGQGKKDEGTKF
jgi:hypothetical protein